MITHVVFFWTDKQRAEHGEKLLAGANELLPQIPGVLEFHCGKPVPSPRGVVDESFAAALSMVFADQATADRYQSHPLHVRFVEEYAKPYARRTLVYDFA